MRRFLTALVLVLAIYLVYSRFAEAQNVMATLQRGHLGWLLLAALTQVAWVACVAEAYRFVYRLLGMEISLRNILALVAASNFVNVAAPSAGVGGMAVFISDARRRDLPVARVTVAGALYLLFDYFGFLCVLTVGLLVLFRRNRLDPASLSAAAGLLILAVTLAALLILGVRSVTAFQQLLVRGARLINRLVHPFIRRDYWPESAALAFATAAGEGLSALRANWRAYLLPAALALLSKGLLVCVLYLTFIAFGQPTSPGAIIAGFSIGYLFVIVSPTPAGLGFVKVSCHLPWWRWACSRSRPFSSPWPIAA
jgi:glycosyltransferase 2 family protein